MADPSTPWSWRLDPAGGHGAVADIGSHIISIARFLAGEITELVGQIETVTKHRPVAAGAVETRPVEVDDQARALVRFASGATGSIEASWVSVGRKMTIAFEVTGTKGTIAFDQERMNELHLFTTGQPRGREGFRTILSGPAHPHYAAFCPAPGHHLGFNDMKTIEVRAILEALGGGPAFMPDFGEALRIQQTVDAIVRSARERCWVRVADM
jgi:predicted dehydrogenase